MKLDLAKALQANANAGTGEVRSIWTGGRIEIDELRMLDLIARAVAITMGNNLFRGIRTDGSGPMPARQYDGQPRGTGALIARALAPVKIGPHSWLIAAHREKAGHLARLMGGIPFTPPPLDTIRSAVHNAFQAALKLSEATEAARALPAAVRGAAGASARAARRTARAGVSALRDAYRTQLGEFGLRGKTPERSGLGKRIRSASRKTLRSRARVGG